MGGNRRRRKHKQKKIKRQRRRRADANGCAKRAQRRAPDRGNGSSSSPGTSGDVSRRSAGDGARNDHKPGTARRCAHCGKRRYWLRRSLCWQCYADPIIRGKYFTPEHTYLARSPDMRDALDLLAGRDVLAEKAAPCPGPLPGCGRSPERIAALEERADAKAALFPPLPRMPLAGVAKLFGVRVEGPNEHPLPAAAG